MYTLWYLYVTSRSKKGTKMSF